MPQGEEKPTRAERETLREWILAGAPFPKRVRRPFVSEKDLLTAIRDDLRKVPENDRRFQRYFSLTHLHNNQKYISDDELRLYRAALSKVVNSLSWKPGIVPPHAIGADESLFRIDLRDVGWDNDTLWKEIVKVYPYGLDHDRDAAQEMRELGRELIDLAGHELLVLRADWFIATATRPPLYHLILGLPEDATKLEQDLKVDVQRDFDRNRLARAGFQASRVSRQNRLVDRHEASYGAYWKSYDFKKNDGTADLLHFPLGPVFPRHPFPKQAFDHDGGEIIFNLPNGLQGYLLVDGKNQRIDAGPIEVVRDAQETSGSPIIINGLSCMACHKNGMIRFEDRIRNGSGVFGAALTKVQDLFRKQDDMNRLLDEDEDRFLRALDKATGPFLRVEEDKDRKIGEFPEPVGAIARLYVKDLNLDDAAFELGIEDPNVLRTMIESNQALARLGLRPLLNGGTIKRDLWSSLKFTTSKFHEVARQLSLGTPHISF
jgi:serine/threonine-protein kinase